AWRAARVVHEEVAALESSRAVSALRVYLLRLADIGGNEGDSRRKRVRLVATANENARAGLRETLRDSASDPATTTRDDHCLTVEAKIVHRPGILALRPRPPQKQRPRTSPP